MARKVGKRRPFSTQSPAEECRPRWGLADQARPIFHRLTPVARGVTPPFGGLIRALSRARARRKAALSWRSRMIRRSNCAATNFVAPNEPARRATARHFSRIAILAV
jgi:hypothetical protein